MIVVSSSGMRWVVGLGFGGEGLIWLGVSVSSGGIMCGAGDMFGCGFGVVLIGVTTWGREGCCARGSGVVSFCCGFRMSRIFSNSWMAKSWASPMLCWG